MFHICILFNNYVIVVATEMGRILCERCYVQFWRSRAYRRHRCAGRPVDGSDRVTEVPHDATVAIDSPAATGAPAPVDAVRDIGAIFEPHAVSSPSDSKRVTEVLHDAAAAIDSPAAAGAPVPADAVRDNGTIVEPHTVSNPSDSEKDIEVLNDATAAIENPAATGTPVSDDTGRSNSAVVEDWQAVELCDISLPSASPELPPQVDNLGPATPQRNQPIMWTIGTPLPDPPEWASSPTPSLPSEPVTPRGYLEVGTQTAVRWSPTRHVRRRVFEPHIRTLDIYPPATESYGSIVDTQRARRLCDRRRCVAHMLHLCHSEVESGVPTAPGIRFVHLPGLPLELSTAEKRRQLDELLRSHPEKSLVGCGCRTCIAHREMARAWSNALALTRPASRRHQHPSSTQ